MKRIENLEEAIKYADMRLKNLPEGTLYVRNFESGYRYYVKADGPRGKETYLSSKDTEIIKGLQEKNYYKELKKVAEAELDSLKKIQKLHSKTKSIDQVFFDLPENKRNLIEPYVPVEIEEAKKSIEKECKFWAREKFERKGISKDLNLTTLNGEKVRSKSELIIADRLKNADVPYYYEGKYVFIDDDLNSKKSAYERDYDVWFPDFQVLNTRTGELLFWEHFGMMDNPEYCASAQFKIETYAKHGFIMGKNMIVTMESSQHTLNVAYIDKLIEEFLK